MRVFTYLGLLLTICFAAARNLLHVERITPKLAPKTWSRIHTHLNGADPLETRDNSHERNAQKHKYLTPKTKKFAVKGKAIPEVDFDVGESYAGLLPVSSKKEERRKLYFWFFPTENPEGKDEVTIWLNGGPGCSSLAGLLQGNGPFLWQYGTFRPVKNPYTWVNLTNMVWVDQPVGTGFSEGTPDARNEFDSAAQFLGFFKNFLDTFDLHHKKIYITGESYAGYYIPYIADAMLRKRDKKFFDVESVLIYQASTSYNVVHEQVPVVAFVDHFADLFSLNASFTADIHNRARSCGYTSFLNDYLVYPPKGKLPDPPSAYPKGCDLWFDILDALSWTNPCFNTYLITSTCPVLWDVLGYPGSFEYLPKGAEIYFNRTDVQKAINAPRKEWVQCTENPVFVNQTDDSDPSGLSVLPTVIEGLKRTIIGHGKLDYVLIANGTLLMIQNMTWNGAQGFQKKPSSEFYVPLYEGMTVSTSAGTGVLGTTHTERGLTWVEVNQSGHMVPQNAPSAAYRQVEFMLGRIKSLTEKGSFTTQRKTAR